MKSTELMNCAALAALITAGSTLPGWSQDAGDPESEEGIERMVVTAQKQEEDLLDVPVAITAFDTNTLQARQIDNVSDLQFNTPNVSFSKTFFTGTNFQIRGIGSQLTAASADTGVGVHVNDVYLNSPLLFETEYYDVERVEILRGPQGTLYGRNATGGTINMITIRPDLSEFGANVEAEYGNFNNIRVNGAVNVPIIEDVLGLRIAGIYLERDGFSETVNPNADFDDLDSRDQWSVRASLRWRPSEDTTVDVIFSYFDEEDSRVRTAKALCDSDPTAILGCAPTGLGNETANFSATFGGISASDLFLGPFGLFPFGADLALPNPEDLRTTFGDFEPVYRADETFVMAQIEHAITEEITLTLLGSYQESSIFSNQGGSNNVGDLPVPDAVFATFPTNAAFFFPDGQIPVSAVDIPDFAGSIAGRNRLSAPRLFSFDESTSDANQWSIEARFTSSFDGPVNFLVAGYYLDYEGEFDYAISSNSLDYFSAVGSALTAAQFGLPPGFFDGQALAVTVFFSETDLFTLESYAGFGEVYWDIKDNLKATFGARYTVDEKFIRDRQLPLLIGGLVPIGDASIPAIRDTVLNDFREESVRFNEVTGRFVLDWKPELAFTDDTLLYFSYQRGYKGGGINPPVDPTISNRVGTNFDPEFINAFEIGTKNVLLNNALQANLTAFYYDYTGLQVARTVERTVFNENIDATIWGLEGEFLYAPDERWLFNLTTSYLNTSIDEAFSNDARDLTGGRTDVTLIKDLTAAENCIIEHNGAPPPETVPDLLFGLSPAGFLIPAGSDIPGVNAGGAFSALACGSQLDAALAGLNALGLPYTQRDGQPLDLSGNELPNSPTWSFSIGAQYTYPFENGMNLVSRVDYYRQDSSFARIFNSPNTDVIDGWGQLNLRVTLNGPENRWFISGFVQNALDDDNITGHSSPSSGTGLGTGIFLLDPRLYGVNVGFKL